MTPRGRVFAFGVALVVLYLGTICSIFFCLAKGLSRGSAFVMGLDLLLIVATTVFASSSKFAKEVGWIIRWRNRTGHSWNDYPETEEQKRRFSGELHVEATRLARAVCRAKMILDAHQMRRPRDREAVCAARITFQSKRIDFNEYWEIIEHLKTAPVDPRTGQPYGNREEFLKRVAKNSHRAIRMAIA